MLTQARRLLPALLTLALACAPPTPPTPQGPNPEGQGNPNARFGMPAHATADGNNRQAYLIERPQYVLSYNDKTHGPNWVCWRLRKEDVGNATRAAFQPDPESPRGFARVTAHTYDRSGFDRGHMCPAHDRSADQADCDATFYTTNIVPQAPANNQHAWERLEDYCRRLTREGHVLYIAAGPHGIGGTGKKGHANEIGADRLKVTVPHKLWKVALVLPREDAQPRKNSRVIAVVMPNEQSVGYDWTKYRVTARAVEKLTGYTFFGKAPEEVAEALRDHVDRVEVHVSVPRHPPRKGKGN